MFVCLFTVNNKTTARIDAKRSGITKNDPESVLWRLKSSVLVFLGRYRDISDFSFAAEHHFYVFSFHFRLLLRCLTQSASQNGKTTARIDAKRSGITTNNLESFLRGLKSPVLVFLGRYRVISVFFFAADRHFTYLPFTSGFCLDAQQSTLQNGTNPVPRHY